MRDLTVRGRCFLAAGAAAIICGIQIGERDFVRIGLLALRWCPCWPGCCCAAPSATCGYAATSAPSRSRPARPPQVQVEVGNAGTAHRHAAARGGAARRRSGSRSGSWSTRWRRAATSAVRYLIRTEHRGRYPVGPMHVRVGRPARHGRPRPGAPVHRVASWSRPRTEPLPHDPAHRALGRRRRQPHPRPARRRQPRRHHPRVPPRRRPAPDPLAAAARAPTS